MSWWKDSPNASYYEPPEAEELPPCPECGSTNYECLYRCNRNHEIYGCSDCLDRIYAEDIGDDLDD